MATVTVTSGGDYASLNAAFAGEAGDLVTAAAGLTINCSVIQDTTMAAMGNGWTTNATYFVTIQGDNTTGAPSTSHYRLWKENVTAHTRALDLSQTPYTVVRNLEIRCSGTANYKIIYGIECSTNAYTYATVEGCVIHDIFCPISNTNVGIAFYRAATIRNNVIYATGSHGIQETSGSSTGGIVIQNNTIYNYDTRPNSKPGLQLGASNTNVDIRNNLVIAGPATTGTCYSLGGATGTLSNNASSDTTGDSGFHSYTTSEFTDYTTFDFTLASGASSIANGADLSGQFTTDVTGATRSTWDIGAFYYSSGSGPQNLSPGLLTRTKTILAPTVTTGAVSLSPGLLTRTKTIHEPTVTASYDLSPSLLTQTKTIHVPSVTVGAVDLSPSLLTQTKTIHLPTVTLTGGPQNLEPGLLTRTKTIHAPTVTASYDLSPSLLTQTKTIHAPTVTASYDLLPGVLTQGKIIHVPTVTAGSVNLSPSLLTRTKTIFVPEVTQGAAASQNLQPGLLTRTKTIFEPSVTVGSVDLQPALLTRTKTIFVPTVVQDGGAQYLSPSLLSHSKTIFEPTVGVGSVNLSPSLLSRSKTVFSPSVTATYDLNPPLVTRTHVLYAPEVRLAEQFLYPPLLARQHIFPPATVTGGDAPIAVTKGGVAYNRQPKKLPKELEDLIRDLERDGKEPAIIKAIEQAAELPSFDLKPIIRLLKQLLDTLKAQKTLEEAIKAASKAVELENEIKTVVEKAENEEKARLAWKKQQNDKAIELLFGK